MAKQTTSTPQNKPEAGASGSRPVRPRPSGATRGNEAVANRVRSAPPIGNFVRDSWGELKKCTWPTRQETTNLTVAVIAMTLGIAVFLGLFDALLDQIVKVLIG